uniref:Uncharacterized protein n=1 Tax=Anguilla anguilla TaxID=7936 RepID=A0A0E9QIG0_ANGAN
MLGICNMRPRNTAGISRRKKKNSKSLKAEVVPIWIDYQN